MFGGDKSSNIQIFKKLHHHLWFHKSCFFSIEPQIQKMFTYKEYKMSADRVSKPGKNRKLKSILFYNQSHKKGSHGIMYFVFCCVQF